MPGASPLALGWTSETGGEWFGQPGIWIWTISVYPGLGHVADSSPYPFHQTAAQ